MKHWLKFDSIQVRTLSLVREACPDNAGAIQGVKSWYDYAGKTNSAYEGSNPHPCSRPACARMEIPDSRATERNTNGWITSEVSTY